MPKPRIHLSRSAVNELWELWKSGATQLEIAQALSVERPKIRNHLDEYGGITPAARRARPDALTFDERCEIYFGIGRQQSGREIARALGRHPSTISREISRNGGRQRYRPEPAHKRSEISARRPQTCKLAENPTLAGAVATMLRDDLSPQQIAGRLKLDFPGDHTMRVSHETIYRTLYIQARGALKRELIAHLKDQKQLRRPSATKEKVEHIKDAISISERPAEAEDRAVPGHWEGDLIAGTANQSQIATLVERSTRFVMLVKVDSKAAPHVADALSQKIKELPEELRLSLTWDRGTEMADHKSFTLATEVPVFFCDPYKPWQRGSNENTNGLLRRYLPKNTDLSVHSQEELDAIAHKLNRRPRQTLEFHTPAEKIAELLR